MKQTFSQPIAERTHDLPSREGGLPRTTVVGSLDMARENDRHLLRKAVDSSVTGKNDWGFLSTDEQVAYASALRVALDLAQACLDHKAIASITQTFNGLVACGQRDRHKAIDVALANEARISKAESEAKAAGAAPVVLVVNIMGINDPDPEAKGPEVVAEQKGGGRNGD